MSYQLYHSTTFQINRLITKNYSTSFSTAVRLLSKETREGIYNIYGFVRVADEIVDTFLNHNQEELIFEFEQRFYHDLERQISYNPVINGFIQTVIKYNIPLDLVGDFLSSMKMDLYEQDYNQELYEQYIHGSANVVGLMCLQVFLRGDEAKYEELSHSAMKLGSAFQKVNFLRDLKDDTGILARQYFPDVDFDKFSQEDKDEIIKDIENDFKEAYKGIVNLPADAKLAVYVAYKYYSILLKKLKRTSPEKLMGTRVRVANARKMGVFANAYIKYKLNVL